MCHVKFNFYTDGLISMTPDLNLIHASDVNHVIHSFIMKQECWRYVDTKSCLFEFQKILRSNYDESSILLCLDIRENEVWARRRNC